MKIFYKNLQYIGILFVCSVSTARHLKKSSASKKNTYVAPPTTSNVTRVAPQLRKQLQAFFKLEDEVEKHLTPEQKMQMQITKSQVRLKAAQLLKRLGANNSVANINDSKETAGILSKVVTAGSIQGAPQQKQEHHLPTLSNGSRNSTMGKNLAVKNIALMSTLVNKSASLEKKPTNVSQYTAPGKVLKEDTTYWKSLAQSFETMAHELQKELKAERAKDRQGITALQAQNAQLRQQIMYLYSQGDQEEGSDEDDDPEDEEDEEDERAEREMAAPPEREMETPSEREMAAPLRDDEESMQAMYNLQEEKQMHPMGGAVPGYWNPQTTQSDYSMPQMRDIVTKNIDTKNSEQEQRVKTADTLQKVSVIQKPASL